MVPEDTYPVQWTGRQALVALPEHIDVSNAEPIREELLSVISRGAEALIVDMTATISCDRAGADAVARAYQRAVTSRTELRLVVTSGVVLRMLGMTGVGRLVPVYPSVEAASAARSPAAIAARAAADRHHAGGVRRRQTAGPPPANGADVGVEVALLDRDGVIAWVNEPWQAFAAVNGGDPARTGPGVSYLQACAGAGDDSVAQEVAGAIRAALAGDLPGPLAVEVPCHSPAAERWFDVLISSRLDDRGRCLGATVTLSLARSRPRAVSLRPELTPARGPGGAGVLWTMIEALNDGVALADEEGRLVLATRRLEEIFGYQPAELAGQPVERLIPAHLQAAHRGHLAGYAQAPRVRPMGAGARLTGLRKDGTTFPAEISLSPVQTATARYSLAVVRDMTAAPGTAARSRQELLDAIIGRLYQVGVSLQTAGCLPRDTAGPRIEEALRTLDDAISQIRDATFADREDREDREDWEL